MAGAALVAVGILSESSNYFSKMTLAKGSENFMKNIRDTLFHHIEKLLLRLACASSDREIIQRCTSDVEVIWKLRLQPDAGCVPNRFPDGSVPNCVFHERETLSGGAAFIPVIVGYSGFFYSKHRRSVREGRRGGGSSLQHWQENLTGVRVVRAFEEQHLRLDCFDERNERFAGLLDQTRRES